MISEATTNSATEKKEITVEDMRQILEAVLKEKDQASTRFYRLERRVAELEQDRDSVIDRHIKKRMLGEKEAGCGSGEECESPISKALRRLR